MHHVSTDVIWTSPGWISVKSCDLTNTNRKSHCVCQTSCHYYLVLSLGFHLRWSLYHKGKIEVDSFLSELFTHFGLSCGLLFFNLIQFHLLSSPIHHLFESKPVTHCSAKNLDCETAINLIARDIL